PSLPPSLPPMAGWATAPPPRRGSAARGRALLSLVAVVAAVAPASEPGAVVDGTAYIVETIPLDTSTELVEGGRHTWEVLLQFIREAREKIDFTPPSAMYWRLLHRKEKKNASWAYDRGAEVHAALRSAAGRGVKLRALCGAGLDDHSEDHREIEDLQGEYPDFISFQIYDPRTWYGGGIQHMKAHVCLGTRMLRGPLRIL
ncbi:unnamed protein product, partial [Prorocentrum cordatum]